MRSHAHLGRRQIAALVIALSFIASGASLIARPSAVHATTGGTARLTLRKTVSRGLAPKSLWSLTARQNGAVVVTGSDSMLLGGPRRDIPAGIETVLSESGPGTYEQVGAWSCPGVTVTGANKVTLTAGTNITCTVTNQQKWTTLTIRKTLRGHFPNDVGATFSFRVGCVSSPRYEVTKSVQLTDSSEDLEFANVPEGSLCTVTETAWDPRFLPSLPKVVTVDPNMVVSVDDHRVTGPVVVTKRVRGAFESDLSNASFTFTLDCPTEGYTDVKSASIDASKSHAHVVFPAAPAFGDCTVTETPPSPAIWDYPSEPIDVGTILPILGTEVKVTNTRKLADVSVTATFSAPTMPGGVPTGETQKLRFSLSCTGPTVERDSGELDIDPANPGATLPYRFDGVPVGASCTARQQAAGERRLYVMDGERTTVVPGDVSFANTRKVAPLTVIKTVSGALPNDLPTSFSFSLRCTDPSFESQRSLTVASPPAGSPPEGSAIFESVPYDATCSITEGAHRKFSPVSPTQDDVKVPEKGTTLTFVNSRSLSDIAVSKTLTGRFPDDGSARFEFTLKCPTAGYEQGPVVVDVSSGADREESRFQDVPTDLACDVEESLTDPKYAEAVAPQSITTGKGVAVTFTNTRALAAVTITKRVTGAFTGDLPASFGFTLKCAGPKHEPGQKLVVLSTSPAGSTVFTGVPVGSTCSVEETTADTRFVRDGSPRSIGPLGPLGAEVTVENARKVSAILITKALDVPLAGDPASVFSFAVSCTSPVVPARTVPLTVAGQTATVTVENIPVGGACSVAETQTDLKYSPSATSGTVEKVSEGANIVVFTNSRRHVTVAVAKELSGALPDDPASSFDFTLRCPSHSLTRTLALTASPGASLASGLVEQVPAGLACAISETLADAKYDPDPSVQVVSTESLAGPVGVTFTNVRRRPAIAIVKTASTNAVTAGDTVTFTFALTNTGNTTLFAVAVADPVCTTTPSGPIFTVGDNDGDLEVGERWTYTCAHSVVVGDADPLPGTAVATAQDGGGAPVRAEVSLSLDVLQPGLTLTKAAGSTVAFVGRPVSFVLTVGNAGDATAVDVVLTDPLPGGLTWSVTGEGCAIAAGTLTCTYASLPPGSLRTATVTAFALTEGTLTNTASVSGTFAAQLRGLRAVVRPVAAVATATVAVRLALPVEPFTGPEVTTTTVAATTTVPPGTSTTTGPAPTVTTASTVPGPAVTTAPTTIAATDGTVSTTPTTVTTSPAGSGATITDGPVFVAAATTAAPPATTTTTVIAPATPASATTPPGALTSATTATTPAPQVLGTTVIAVATRSTVPESPTTRSPTVQALGEQVARAPEIDTLPFTGGPVDATALVGFVLIVLGAALVVLAFRKRGS